MAALGEQMKRNIVIEKGKLLVKKFETSDREIVDYFEGIEPDACEERFETALKTGVTALKTVGITEKIDYIEKKFDGLNAKFSDSLDTTIDELDAKYEEIFGEKGKFAEIIKSHFGEDGKIIKELFDPSREGSPLNILRNEMRSEISGLKTLLQLEEQKGEIEQKTPLKGARFEDACEEVLNAITRMHGDKLERTTDIVGKIRASKKGDFVVELKENAKKVVYEVKDLGKKDSGKQTLPAILRSIEDAMTNRDASYGVFLVKNVEALPQSVGWFNEYDGNKLVCALGSETGDEKLHGEILLISYKWAKAKVMLQALREQQIDAEFIQNKITKIQQKLSELTNIKTNCTNIETASDKIRKIVQSLQDEIGTELSEILGSLVTK